ncbi:hypothetical protein ABT346_14565 [Micromonospora peucetia]
MSIKRFASRQGMDLSANSLVISTSHGRLDVIAGFGVLEWRCTVPPLW